MEMTLCFRVLSLRDRTVSSLAVRFDSPETFSRVVLTSCRIFKMWLLDRPEQFVSLGITEIDWDPNWDTESQTVTDFRGKSAWEYFVFETWADLRTYYALNN